MELLKNKFLFKQVLEETALIYIAPVWAPSNDCFLVVFIYRNNNNNNNLMIFSFELLRLQSVISQNNVIIQFNKLVSFIDCHFISSS